MNSNVVGVLILLLMMAVVYTSIGFLIGLAVAQ